MVPFFKLVYQSEPQKKTNVSLKMSNLRIFNILFTKVRVRMMWNKQSLVSAHEGHVA